MKTSGFRCETKFGLFGFLGHPSREASVVIIGPSCKRGNILSIYVKTYMFSSKDLPSFCVRKSDDEVLKR